MAHNVGQHYGYFNVGLQYGYLIIFNLFFNKDKQNVCSYKIKIYN